MCITVCAGRVGHKFKDPGLYEVSLTASDNIGCTTAVSVQEPIAILRITGPDFLPCQRYTNYAHIYFTDYVTSGSSLGLPL